MGMAPTPVARSPGPVAERAAAEALSLPLYPELEEGEVLEVVGAVRDFFAGG